MTGRAGTRHAVPRTRHRRRTGVPPRGLLPVALCLLPLLASRPVATLATTAPAEAAVTVTTTVTPRSVTIGTPFRYTLRIEAGDDVEVLVPTVAGYLGEFQVVDFGAAPPRQEGGRVVREHWLDLLTYTVGDRVVPGPSIQYREPGGALEHLAAPETLVIVDSLLARAAATPALRDIKGPVAVPRDYSLLWQIALGVLAVLAAVAGVLSWLRRRRRPAAVPPRPAHEIALEALGRLRDERLVEQGRQEEYYVRLSAIVRAYLEARFHLRAPEMTTEEFLQAAQRDRRLAPPQRAGLAQFLTEADLVKFARHQPSAGDAARAHEAARELVAATAPSVEVPRAVA